MVVAGYSVYFANPGGTVGVGFYWNCTPVGLNKEYTCFSGFPGWLAYLVGCWVVFGVVGMYLLFGILIRRFTKA